MSLSHNKVSSLAVFFTISTLALSINQVHASDSNTTNTIDKGVLDLGTLSVTARGYKENQLETPFVVSTVNKQTLKEQNQVTVEDAMRNQPSVDIHNGGNVAYSMLWMRGTGSLSITSLDDNSVDFIIDGISNGKTGLARNLLDVEQVQVAKGPQGTLLGSKAEAGSVLIKTNDPEDVFLGHVGVGVGSDNLKSAEAIVNVPLTDNVAVRLAGMSSQVDNQLTKREDGNPLNTKEKQSLQAKLAWQQEANKAVFGAYFDEQTNNVPVLQTELDNHDVASLNLKHESATTAKGFTLTTESDTEIGKLHTNLGYHSYQGDVSRPSLPPEMFPVYFGMFGVPAAQQPMLKQIFALPKNNGQYMLDKSEQVSTQFRLTSKDDSKVKWVAGVHFDKRGRDWYNNAKVNLAELPAGLVKTVLTATAGNGESEKSFDSTSRALFGEVNYPLTNKLAMMTGARVTREQLKYHSSWQGNSNNMLATSVKTDKKSLDETATTGRVGLSYALTPQWRVYGLQSRGHKFGGFADYETNVVYGNPTSFYKPTTIDASELGTKYQSANGKLNLGLAVYKNVMKDDHITVIGTPPKYESRTANVDSESQGAEVSVQWQPVRKLTLSTNLAYTDAKVTNADDVPPSAIPTSPKLTETGNKMPQVPEFTGSLGLRYADDINNLPLFGSAYGYLGADYRYVGKRFAQSYNVFELEDYGLLGVNAGIMNDSHEISIWGKNLTDKRYQYIGAQPANVVTVAPARTFGVKYKYMF